jgi:hypothetical protein
MTLFPFIILKHSSLRENKVLMHHERIHIRQQFECLLVIFYLIYVIEFLIHLVRYQNIEKAYRRISFEREAYSNERDFDYLEKRKIWTWLKYL